MINKIHEISMTCLKHHINVIKAFVSVDNIFSDIIKTMWIDIVKTLLNIVQCLDAIIIQMIKAFLHHFIDLIVSNTL